MFRTIIGKGAIQPPFGRTCFPGIFGIRANSVLGSRRIGTVNRDQNLTFRTSQLKVCQLRFSLNHTSSPNTNTSNNNSTNNTNYSDTNNNDTNYNDTNNKNKRKFSSDIFNLLQLARPEIKILLGALTCLIITSSVTMSLPLLVGKIIDTAKPLEKSQEERKKEQEEQDEQGDKLIFGLTETQFYVTAVTVFSIGSLSNFGRIYLLKLAGEKLVARLRSRLFLKILSQDSYFFDVGPTKTGMKVGDLISRILSDTQIISKSLSGNISDGSRALISGAVGLSMMCYVSWKLTFCMSLLFPPLIMMSVVYGRRVKELSRKVQENLGDMTKVTEEKLNGLKTIQVFARQNLVVHDYNKEIRKLFQTSMREGKLLGIFFSGNGFLGNVMIVGLLWVGTRLINSGDLTIGDLSSFMMYAAYTGSSVFGLGNFYTELMKGIGAAERVFELSNLTPKIPTTLGKKIDSIHGDIVFKDIKFSYPSRPDISVFGDKELNLTIKQGDNVCFVGPSGSGKSTISQLLLRFYDPAKGSVLVNNVDIRDLNLNYYRSQIGYVQQEPLLFSGTIRDNITFGKSNCSDEEIDRALTLSNAHTFVKQFPQGLDTLIGPSSSGAQLSGGQKQRISLARTLIKNPNILVLDEATSALDTILEEIVMRNLRELSLEKSVTMILIAHRLSTIKNSKRIIVLGESGEIIEEGPFSELYGNKNSQFNKLLKKNDVE